MSIEPERKADSRDRTDLIESGLRSRLSRALTGIVEDGIDHRDAIDAVMEVVHEREPIVVDDAMVERFRAHRFIVLDGRCSCGESEPPPSFGPDVL